MSDRRERAERARDFFELQLRFAQHMAERTGAPLGAAVASFTTLHRRFGLGDPGNGIAPAWEDYVGPLEQLRSIGDQVAWTQRFYVAAAEETLPAGRRFFGCSGFEQPDAQGVVQIHFLNRDSDTVGPIHHSKLARRRRDLAQMIDHISAACPTATTIRGISWLYHLEAYRRLFPPEYGASATPAPRVRLCGLSSWGQFVSHDGRVKPALCDAFLQNFAGIDLAAPWRSFPLPALTVSAPLAVFRAFYAGQR